MGRIRVLVVDDSLTVRRHLVDVVGSDPDLEVVGEAEDGRRAIELCESLRPDVITLDMALPVMSGLAVTEYIMAYHPTPILIVSASFNRGTLLRTYDALAAGAVDVLEKPRGDEPDDAWERALRATLKLVSRIRVITHPRASLGAIRRGSAAPVAVVDPVTSRAVAIGASTGGPAAVAKILRQLPPRFQPPILLVIHIGEAFGIALGEWLDGCSSLRVSLARDGEALPAIGESRVILCPPGRHMELEKGHIRLSAGPERHSCRPSVDVLFESMALELGEQGTACLLTGMGRDGAAGLLAVRRAGGRTIAQDEATAVVFGMPREAIAIGAAERVLALDEIAPALATLTGDARPRRPA